ncbi:MAG: phosphoribosyltransferase [Bacillota bacterium]
MYRNRKEAGEKLADLIGKDKITVDLVLAIPRGGVEVAGVISGKLLIPLKVVIPRKIGAPGHEEMAVGALAWEGTVLLNDSIIHALGIPQAEIDAIIAKEREEIRRRSERFPYTPRDAEIRNKNILLVDDGVATGYTVKATIVGLRKLNPAKIFLAAPVGARDTMRELEILTDQVFCPLTTDDFWAVGQFYEDFSQVSDEEVMRVLRECNKGL